MSGGVVLDFRTVRACFHCHVQWDGPESSRCWACGRLGVQGEVIILPQVNQFPDEYLVSQYPRQRGSGVGSTDP